MGIFSLTQELAIDLGTANTIIINNGKIVVDEPSIVAIDQHTGKLVAIGKQARQMHGKTHQNIRTIRPLKDGVIAEEGTHEELLAKNGGYAQLFEIQSRYYQEGRDFRD